MKNAAHQWLSAARISPTALYTGHVWQHSGRSLPELANTPAQLLHMGLAPAMWLSKKLGGPTLEDFLIARHDLIDDALHRGIQSGRITQIIEIAAGLSPRGSRFVEQYGKQITYIECDLPDMAARKRKLLAQRLSVCPNHQVKVIDAFASEGAHSLEGLAMMLNSKQGLAIVTEGLLNYFDKGSVLALWARIAKTLNQFPAGLYLSDIHLESQNADPTVKAFAKALGAFVRGRVYFHFEAPGQVQLALEPMGLRSEIIRPSTMAHSIASCAARGADLTRVIVARTPKTP